MVEFAIVLPVLLAVAFVGLEFSRAMRVKQIAQTISRESASVAFRECSVRTGPRTTDCLNRIRADILNLLAYPGATLVLSMYDFNGTIRAFGPAGGSTRFTMGQLNTLGNPVGDLIRSHRMIVVAEVEVPYATVLPNLSFSLGSNNFYDATVL